MDNERDPSSASGETSTQLRKGFDARAAKWLAIFQEHFRKDISPELAEIYFRALADLTPEEWERGGCLALRTCKFFPTVAEILEGARSPAADSILLEAERAWESFLARIRDFWCDDFGLEHPRYERGKVIQPPLLDAATDYAVRQCGGRYGIEYSKPEAFHFVRRDFLAAYSRFQQTGGLDHLPLRFADLPAELQQPLRKALKPMDRPAQ
jgi:hypothetical protein